MTQDLIELIEEKNEVKKMHMEGIISLKRLARLIKEINEEMFYEITKKRGV